MINNPFLSKIFSTIWLKHFNNGKAAKTFNFIKNVGFIENKYFSLFTNVGKNITNGMYYTLGDINEQFDYKNKVFLIHDVPEYFKVNTYTGNSKLKIKKVNQYKGLAAELSEFKTFDEFFNNQFRSKRRNYIKKKKQQLEICFNIEYTFLYGEISKEEFQINMLAYQKLFELRFGEKGIATSSLSNWDYYYDLLYNMILDKKANLFIIKADGQPICGSFNFLSEEILFFSSQSFDNKYFRFGLGHIMISELGKWCFENNISVIDFSKGDFEYKKRWTNLEYYFQIHVLYDSGSLISTLLSTYISNYFKFKQYLRKRKINVLFSNVLFFIKNLGRKNDLLTQNYKIEYLKDTINLDNFELIKITQKYLFLNAVIIEVLSNNPEPISNLKVYSKNGNDKEFVFLGSKSKCSVLFN